MKIKHRIKKKKNLTGEPVSPKQRIAICLYRLGRGDYLYTITEMVGLAESTVCQIVVEVCKAIVEELWSEAVDHRFPKSDEDFKEYGFGCRVAISLCFFLYWLVATYQ